MSYRFINPTSGRELSLRMLVQPAGDGTFQKACEADSWRGLVAALLNDPAYEHADVETRLVDRLRLANDVAILSDLDGRRLRVADQPGPDSIEISSDESLVRSLDKHGVVSLEPGLAAEDSNGS